MWKNILLIYFIGFYSICCFAAPNTTQIPSVPSNTAIDAVNATNAPKDPNAPNAALSQSLIQLQNHDVRWLTSNTGNFLALYTLDKTGNRFGTVILLHGNGHHPDWPGLIHTLRSQLPEVGWSTLSIAVPRYEYRTDAPTLNTQNNIYYTSATLMPAIAQRIQQSLPLITDANKPIVILAEGLSAGWMLNLSNQLTDPRFKGFILVDAQNAPDSPPIDFAQLLQQPQGQQPQPVRYFLDFNSPSLLSFKQAQDREITARRLRSDRYQLVNTASSLEDFSSPVLFKQLRGWLRKRFEGNN